eukprot:TRINITY_DN63580_c0_g1_i1.p1 TRINITY_DN63580_c0_g1~~TRINITY_DN63580_c0_g1_i1.p1  ORF type:complete len:105 (+),score=22.28 TRINITY_DN63580_c0_g1_i1:25-315(+)
MGISWTSLTSLQFIQGEKSPFLSEIQRILTEMPYWISSERFVQTGLMMLYEVTKELTEKLDALDLDEKSSSIRSQVVLQLNGLKKRAEANLKDTST